MLETSVMARSSTGHGVGDPTGGGVKSWDRIADSNAGGQSQGGDGSIFQAT